MDKLNNNINDDTASKEIEAGLSGFGVKSRIWVIAIIAVVIVAAVWITKSNEVSHVKEEAQKSTVFLKRQAEKEVVHSHEEHIKLLAKPLVWALSAQMEQGNLKQAERYLDEMVKEQNFMLLAVVDTKGKIILATNKNYKGQPFSKIGNEKALSSMRVNLENKNDKLLLMTCPITGKKGRLGTLFIQYKVVPTP